MDTASYEKIILSQEIQNCYKFIELGVEFASIVILNEL